MFIVNGRMLSKKESPELFKWYEEKADSIRDSEKVYYIFSSQKSAVYETDDHGRKRKIRKYKSIPATSTFMNKDFSESQTWTYVASANSIRNDNGMITVVNQKPFAIGPRYNLHRENDVEIVFFLMYISEALTNGHIYEIDAKKDSIERAAKSKVAAEAQYMLYSDVSPVSPENTGSEDAIRQIAMSFGVLGVVDKNIAEVRNALWDRVMEKEKTKDRRDFGFDGLIKAINKIKNSSKRATILTAVELGFLYYDSLKWYLQIKGSATRELCNVPAGREDQKNEFLIDYVLLNREFFDLITASVKNPEKMKTKEMDDKPNRENLMNEAIALGWERKDIYKKPNAFLKELVENSIQPEEVKEEKTE